MTREKGKSFKFRRVGPARWWHDALQPLLKIYSFNDLSRPIVTHKRGTEDFGRFGKNVKKVIPRKVLLFSGKFPPGRTVPFEFSPEFPGFPHKWQALKIYRRYCLLKGALF